MKWVLERVEEKGWQRIMTRETEKMYSDCKTYRNEFRPILFFGVAEKISQIRYALTELLLEYFLREWPAFLNI